jgi:hypothetical protein
MNVLNKSLLMAAVALSATTTLTSCLFEDDDKFDESAALRIEHFNEEVQELLVSAPNGWVMQYFANPDSKGYNLFCRFDESGTVTFASNHEYLRNGNAGKYTEATSLYELLKEDGPVLSFNSWNDVFSIFTDPVDPTSGEKDGVGLGGDQNYVILSASTYEIRLRGERQSGEVRMFPASKDWQEYLADVAQTGSDIFNSSISNFYVVGGADTLYASNFSSGLMLVGERIVDPIVTSVVPFVLTDQGIRLQFETEFNHIKATEFFVSSDSTCLTSEDDAVRLIPMWDAYVASHSDVWQMDTTYFSADQKALYQQLAADISSINAAWELQYIGVGVDSRNTYLLMGVQMGKSFIKAGCVLNATCPAYGEVSYTADTDDTNSNLNNLARRNDEIQTLFTAFAESINGTYTVVPNNYFLPTGAIFTPKQGGTAIKFQ